MACRRYPFSAALNLSPSEIPFVRRHSSEFLSWPHFVNVVKSRYAWLDASFLPSPRWPLSSRSTTSVSRTVRHLRSILQMKYCLADRRPRGASAYYERKGGELMKSLAL